jgi:transposase-like protein
MTMKVKLSEFGCYQMFRQIRWPDGIVCPYRGCRRVTTHSKSLGTPRRRYLCLACRRTFTDLTGTPFARTNLHLATWFLCFDLVESGLTTSELAKQLGVKWDTAAHIQRRIGAAINGSSFINHLRQTLRESR